uniref:protein-tyrosine-phosphatase n=1 Tax=Chromera velia CCMP2878 TaxID=1169474 RepID=A0A0G4HQ00_9ALVE|eukprot:Cvel_7907.t1-p1 / transcript=Cvel_7907.t1 / gene=Cvel_7907 / organism=Chromera_velia_CCMP2878 / gene_product=Dual specificity protein phosphatase 1, putative / transcript_product=Dual specificity protein phosphatase 1, putative / location=Cvel_scaffold424:8648-13444(-) / protein_length=767 / sequence_SO=supercontig / SO=protein_coding / is_pseudo=false
MASRSVKEESVEDGFCLLSFSDGRTPSSHSSGAGVPQIRVLGAQSSPGSAQSSSFSTLAGDVNSLSTFARVCSSLYFWFWGSAQSAPASNPNKSLQQRGKGATGNSQAASSSTRGGKPPLGSPPKPVPNTVRLNAAASLPSSRGGGVAVPFVRGTSASSSSSSSTALPAPVQQMPNNKPPYHGVCSHIPVPNCTGELFVSDLVAASTARVLMSRQVSMVVCANRFLADDEGRNRLGLLVASLGVELIWVPMMDSDSQVLNFSSMGLDELHEALEQGRNVLINCRKGRSRSVAIAAAYLMLKKGYTCTGALELIRGCRPCAGPSRSFVAQLYDLEWSLQRQQRSQLFAPSSEGLVMMMKNGEGEEGMNYSESFQLQAGEMLPGDSDLHFASSCSNANEEGGEGATDTDTPMLMDPSATPQQHPAKVERERSRREEDDAPLGALMDEIRHADEDVEVQREVPLPLPASSADVSAERGCDAPTMPPAAAVSFSRGAPCETPTEENQGSSAEALPPSEETGKKQTRSPSGEGEHASAERGGLGEERSTQAAEEAGTVSDGQLALSSPDEAASPCTPVNGEDHSSRSRHRSENQSSDGGDMKDVRQMHVEAVKERDGGVCNPCWGGSVPSPIRQPAAVGSPSSSSSSAPLGSPVCEPTAAVQPGHTEPLSSTPSNCPVGTFKEGADVSSCVSGATLKEPPNEGGSGKGEGIGIGGEGREASLTEERLVDESVREGLMVKPEGKGKETEGSLLPVSLQKESGGGKVQSEVPTT